MNNLHTSETKISRKTAIILLMATAILWSFGGLLIKLVNWNPIAISGTRSAIASVLLLLIIRKPKFTWSFPQIGAAVAYALTVTAFVSANKMTTAANAILLQYTAPIYVALFGAWFLKERTRLFDWITIFSVLGGMVLFFLDTLSAGGLYGNLLAIFSGVTFAFMAIFMRMQKSGSPMESIFLGNVLTAVISLPFMFQSMPDKTSWIGLTLLGLFQLGLSYVLYSTAIKHVTALEATIIPVIEPLLNPVWVFLSMGEIPGTWSLLGGLVVLVSVTLRCVVLAFKANEVKE